jgi:hypothetical protein
MSGQLLAAFGGAVVAFCGTGLLQAARNRREDRDGVRERLGITRGLKAELGEAAMYLDLALHGKLWVTATRYPVAVWEAEGHHLLAALEPDAALTLVEAFAKLRGTNTLMAAAPDLSVPVEAAGALDPEAVKKLAAQVVAALEVLDALDANYAIRERELSTPFLLAPFRRLRKV